ncbi:MAG: hypothetical protein ACYCVD_18225 [Desulfitobacteriaceae bacterium]
MSGEEELEELIEEKKEAYLEHWQNTERLVAVEKEWRLAKEQGDEKHMEDLMPVMEDWCVRVEKSKERAWQATVRLKETEEGRENFGEG